MDNLRLILILAGIVVLAAIVLFHRPGGKQRKHASPRREPRLEPGLKSPAEPQPEAGEDGEQEPAGDEVHQPTLQNLEGPPEPPPAPARRAPEMTAAPAAPRPDTPAAGDTRIVTLYLRVREDRRITGVQLLDAALKAGLTFGEMNIFHRRQEGGERPVFSMANLVKPGAFDPTAWNLFETPGLTLFMALPGPMSALDGWDAMLATGQRLAELLNAELLDDAQCQMTRQRVAQIREELRDFDRQTGLMR